ncbi:hypothetical protein [Streptomyces goshikiensis]|uniref:hypothetical protein n=1 Tax=Streptomyces goshikiensis TaxID=1942 RepID=UPI0036B79881
MIRRFRRCGHAPGALASRDADVLDVETALATADTAAHLRDRIAAGEKVSGPAARQV